MKIFQFCALILLASLLQLNAQESAVSENLLLNSQFDFHSFSNHRNGKNISYMSKNVAFWNTDKWGDLTVLRESHVSPKIRPVFSTKNMVEILPGKRFWQFITLPEVSLAHGDFISLSVFGYQNSPDSIKAKIKLMKLDSETGTWCPKDFGMKDKRTFAKHSRGELVVAKEYMTSSDQKGQIELKIEGAEILGHFTLGKESRSEDMNTVALIVEFQNSGKEKAYVFTPCLVKGKVALSGRRSSRPMTPYYRHIPRTIQKLWKGEPIHIIVMGSSIDRGSANPPMYLYDENPKSKDFKKPLSDRIFDPKMVNRPDLEGYYGWWQHYFSYGGRLKLELMRKFNLGPDKICLNIMACDGSCVGEAHSGLKDYCSLALPPAAHINGHKGGVPWDKLYPELFSRPEGPRPDLVIFGSGANEKTDTPDEVAVFEGMIRWIQQHYPNTEFLFCPFQNKGGYTPNPGDLQAISLRYQIPFMDYGKIGDDLTRWCNPYTLVPRDGHPQAASHFIWFKQLEKAFECWDPSVSGIAQLQLPERIHKNTYGWEGEMLKYGPESKRINRNIFILDDTAVNCWGVLEKDKKDILFDGEKLRSRRSSPRRNTRNSMFRHGNAKLGDRHVLEVPGASSKLTYVDSKVCPNRQFYSMKNKRWNLSGQELCAFSSEFGAPYGIDMIKVKPGESIDIDLVATDLSIAYVDSKDGGVLKITVDGQVKLEQATNIPYIDSEKKERFIENRKGVLNLGYGIHNVKIEVEKAPVTILGVFSYDSRPNRDFERRLNGIAAAGETIQFSLPFKARPIVKCDGSLIVKSADIKKDQITFSGSGTGSYEVVGE